MAGIGRAGTAAARALAARPGPPARAWDGLDRPQERQASTALARLGIDVHRGDGVALLDQAPLPRTVVKSPGLPFTTPLIEAAVHRGLTVLDEAELGWLLDPRPFIAVTGTNGKSTTTSLIAAILQASGRTPVTAGNTRFGVPLSEAHLRPGDVVVAELSSFQLEGCAALRPDAAVLTNVTLDHLYRHGSIEAYTDCKRRLFDGVPVAAVGVDQPAGRNLARDLRARGATVVSFGCHPAADRRVLTVQPWGDGSRLSIAEPGSGSAHTLHPRLVGEHNALNIAAALALADALEIDPDAAAAAVEAAPPLPGRFERVAVEADFDVVVDYAHNPDGVAQAVRTGRAILAGRGFGKLRVVLSALSMVGPDQAHAMALAAGQGADQVVLTTQRWTLSDPGDAVTPGLLDGARAATGRPSPAVEPDRAAAIEHALRAAGPGDLVLILDRGEAAGPLYDRSGTPRPFDDRAEVRALLATIAA